MARLVLLLAFAAACVGDLAKPSEVVDLRVLAIRAEPPEVVLADSMEPVLLTALAVDPRNPGREAAYRWSACGLVDGLRCAEADYHEDLEHGRGPLDQIQAHLLFSDELRTAAREADTFRGFGGVSFVASVIVGDDSEDVTEAFKQVPAPAALPAGTRPNTNPTAPAVVRDGEPWPPDEIADVPSGAEVQVTPVSPEEDSEAYSLYRFDLQTEDLEEHLGYSFFSSDGSWNRETSGGPPNPVSVETSLASYWTAPDEAPQGPVQIWIVVRDGRGGTAWTTRQVEVLP